MPAASRLLYDPSAVDFPEHSHALHDRLRAEDPFHWAPKVGEWIVTRHADVKTVLRHPALLPPDVPAMIARREWESGLPLPALKAFAEEAALLQSGAGHAQARRFMGHVLNQRPAAELVPVMEEIVAEQIKGLRQAGGGDLVAELARAVPLRFTSGLLGVPAEDVAFLTDCAEDVMRLVERGVGLDVLVEINGRAALAVDHLAALCAERRARPRGDGLSRMLELASGEPGADDRRVAVRAFFLMIVGLDTTTTLLGRSMLALLLNEEERGRWQRGEVTDAGAVEELLRYTSPAALVLREMAEDGEVCGRFVMRGQRVTAVIEAANRDPAVFADPHRLDLGRASCPHLSFSDGVHACLGATLARQMAAIALREFIRLPAMRLNGAPRFLRADVVKAFKGLPVVWA